MYLTKNLPREIRLMSTYPFLYRFLHSAYFETNPALCHDLERLKAQHMGSAAVDMLSIIDRSHFKDPQAPEVLLKLITLAVEGYMTFNTQTAFHDPGRVIKEMEQFIVCLHDNSCC